MRILFLVCTIGILTTHLTAAAQDDSQPTMSAIVVGANAAAPGRRPLRYAHNDAREVEQVLRSLGGFEDGAVHVLLDPEPQAILGVLDRELARLSDAPEESLLLFYYSGHADERSLYPGGHPLSYHDLRSRLDNEAVSVRVGIIDSCRGGGWTGTRGLSETEVFEVNVPLTLSNEGSVLIASSSGLEDAHESEHLRGGFFTHHWNAALRGAGDRNGDHTVTLTEAFDYAKRLTIRDTALRTDAPQHPSYRMNLRGRRDLPLVQLASRSTVIDVEQDQGPLQLVHLESGLIVLEVPQGQRALRLSVPPGRYLVRTGSGNQTRAREIQVRPNRPATVREDELAVVGNEGLAARSFEPRPVTLTTVPDGMSELRLALGVRHGAAPGVSLDGSKYATFSYQANRGITDRLQWAIPTLAFAYRGGEQGGFEWIPWGGLTSWGFGFSSIEGVILTGDLGAGLDLRWWFSPRSSLQAGLGVSSRFRWSSADNPEIPDSDHAPTTWSGRLTLGYSHTIGDAVTLSIGAVYAQNLLHRGGAPEERAQFRPRLGLGSVQNLALRSLPLIKVHLSDVASLDGYAAVEYDFATESFEETYMLGATFIW